MTIPPCLNAKVVWKADSNRTASAVMAHLSSPRRQNSRATNQKYLLLKFKGIEAEEKKTIASLKQAAKQPGNEMSCRILAKGLVRSRKAKERIYCAKAQLNSISMQLQQQLGIIW